ncbi:MAG TPA: RNA 2',3'-cyclic phosphodiesterase [Candidatus Thermoplasmatota archaeon]|nr:RNA 2',3'-cyclic phosphodiesterase [Candidatus Thermoplasmatota archaeon]
MAFRGFAAVEVGEQPALQARLTELRALGADLKVVAPENLHLTLKFLGEVPDGKTSAVETALREAAAGVAPFTMDLVGLGTFPPRGAPRVVWAGVQGAEPLTQVATRFETAARALGFAREERAFSPHVTLARARSPRGKEDVIRFVQAHRDEPLGEVRVEELRLMRSELRPTGPVYTPVLTVRLEA